MLEGLKVVTSEEMARIEKLEKGLEEKFMEEAGRLVAESTMEYIQKRHLPKKVTLLVGKGNNGGDAYAAGVYLLEEGYQVHAYPLYKEGSPLNRRFGERFQKKGGKIVSKVDGLVLDGLLGTGFKGKVEDEMAHLIRQVNASGCPVIAIDIPSGLNGTTGEVASVAIKANETIALGLPKIGFFLQNGWNFVGKLKIVDFGLSKKTVEEAKAIAYLPRHLDLPKLVRNRHKYQAGYVVGFGGSKALPGAVKLTGCAALKAGAGIVRLFHMEDIGPVANELISVKWDEKGWKEALFKAGAVFIGPGLGRSKKIGNWLKVHLKQIKQHVVIDADALLPNLPFPKNCVLTPHRGEVLRLLELQAVPAEEDLFAQIMRFCNRKELVLVLKGAPTFIFAPHLPPFIVPHGDPGMATAGAGDVLTGMIAALLAQGCSALEGAILGVSLHAMAGEFAAIQKTSYCLIASDLIDFMPPAFEAL